MQDDRRMPQEETDGRERARYDFLLRLYHWTGADPRSVMHALDVGFDLGLTPVQTFAVVEFLSRRGYIDYLGAGPRIRITPMGVDFIRIGAGYRRTIRE
jgi:hypothetical protein